MRTLTTLFATFAFVVSSGGATSAVWAQAESVPKSDTVDLTALKTDLERLKQEVESLRSEVRSMREFLLKRRGQPQPNGPPARVEAKVAVGDDSTLGTRAAPLTLIEFSDYQCPFCRQFFETTLPTLKKEYVEGGKLRYVFRDFPIDQLHPHARKAAEAARCAGEQGKYWEMHDVLFQNQEALEPQHLKIYAERLGLDGQAFHVCLEGGKYRTLVQQSYQEGLSAGVRGTPSFLLGKTRPDNTIEGVIITGVRPLRDFRQEIERVLAEK